MPLHQTCDGVRRRDVLRAGALGMAGLTLSSYLRLGHAGEVASTAKANSAIFINLNGGPSHMDTFDLKPNSDSEYRGEFNPIATAVPGLEICEHLPHLAQAAGLYTLVRGVSHTLGAHPLGTEYVNSGNRPLPSLEFPGYSAVVTKERPGPSDLPASVSIPNSQQRAGYLGIQYAPLHTGATPQAGKPFSVRGIQLQNGITVADVQRRRELLTSLDRGFAEIERNSLLDGLDRFGEQAYQILTSTRTREAFDISQESPAFAERFGTSPFGQSCLLASRLVGAGVRFVTITMGGWDTHRDNWTALKTKQLPPFDQGLAGLLTGLEEKGLLESTAVYVTGEFGRTPKINTTRVGRDHYPRNMFMLLAGGGFARGKVVGESDANGTEPLHDIYTPDEIAASFYHTLGITHTKEYHTDTGRPVMIVREGKVRPELFA